MATTRDEFPRGVEGLPTSGPPEIVELTDDVLLRPRGPARRSATTPIGGDAHGGAVLWLRKVSQIETRHGSSTAKSSHHSTLRPQPSPGVSPSPRMASMSAVRSDPGRAG